jgi:hypothetical protein
MYMKTIWSICLVLLALSATGICAAEIPDLVGNWAGKGPGYNEETGYVVDADNTLNFSITEQNGRLFSGELTYNLNGTDIVEDFAGTISPDNKTFYIAEFISGYDVGTVVSEDEIDLMYLLEGKSGAVYIETLRRVAK